MLRKFILPVSVVLVLGAGCKEKSKNDTGGYRFRVSGTFTNSKGKKVYLEEISMINMQRTPVDSFALGGDGKYKLETLADMEKTWAIRFDQNRFPTVIFINDSKDITINAAFSDRGNEYAEQYEVKGSSASQQYKDYFFLFNNELMNLYQADMQTDSLSKLSPVNENLITQIMTGRKQKTDSLKLITRKLIDESNSPALGMYILAHYQTANRQSQYLQLVPFNDDEVYTIVSALSSRFPAHQGIVKIREQLDIQKKQQQEQLAFNSQWIGKPAPEISMQDPMGKQVSLSSFRGKYVLVDFWASWCGPCRMENPNVVAAFQKFRDKNFTILGVSLDSDKEPWKKAIMKDNLTWTHISDLKKWDSPVVPLYNISGIPFNVLVNPEGTIVAQNLRGGELHSKLAEVLK